MSRPSWFESFLLCFTVGAALALLIDFWWVWLPLAAFAVIAWTVFSRRQDARQANKRLARKASWENQLYGEEADPRQFIRDHYEPDDYKKL